MIRSLFAIFLLLFALPSHGQSTQQWEQVLFKNESYVTLENVKNFYGFTAISRTGDKITLDKVHLHGNRTQILFLNGQQGTWINGVKFLLSLSLIHI